MIIKKVSHSVKNLGVIAGVFFMSAAVDAGTWQPETIIGEKLSAHLFVPDNPPLMTSGRALMVNLHGCGQSHGDLKTGGNWETPAENYGAVIAIPRASNESGFGGCWDYHEGMNADRNESDAKYLISLVNTLTNDPLLNIDPAQVFISGFSAGGSMANQMACLAPDIFSGAGVVAGLAPGDTGEFPPPFVLAVIGKNKCETLAGSYKDSLYSQKYSYVIGAEDMTIDPAHAEENIQIFREVYAGDGNGLAQACTEESIPGGGELTLYCDEYRPVISKIIVSGMEHRWPSGPGALGSGPFIDHNHINYPSYIADFFFNFDPHPPTPTATPTPTPTVEPTPIITPTPVVTPVITPWPHPCTVTTSSNWLHKLAGRAYSTGLWWAPNYFSRGFDEPMAGSTWGETTLYSVSETTWSTNDVCLFH